MSMGFLCVLNLLADELNFSEKKVKRQKDDGFLLKDPELYIAQGIRKPQAAIDKSDHGNVKFDEGSYKKFIFTSHKNIPDNPDQDIGADDSDEEYPDGGLVDDDDDDDDADDDKDNTGEGLNDKFKTGSLNKIFEPYDFQNMSKLIFAKPPLRFQEIPNGKQMSEEKVMVPSDVKEPLGKHAVSEGIFWSTYVEKMVPKGRSSKKNIDIDHRRYLLSKSKSYKYLLYIEMTNGRGIYHISLLSANMTGKIWN